MGLKISGLVQSKHALLEDSGFCQEVFDWALLCMARILSAKGGRVDGAAGALFHWTGIYEVSIQQLEVRLGVDAA